MAIRTFEELLSDHAGRITRLERRLPKGGSGGGAYDAHAGMIMPYAGSVPPTGWLLCDGSAVSRASYGALFAAIGTIYGAGDGSSTFNLPNLKGRVPVGQDAGQGEFDVLGEAGGEKAVTLTIDQMPSHSHQWAAAGTNNPGGTPANWDDIVGANASALGVGPANPEQGNGISPRGGGQAHTNLQPYVVTNYIISIGSGVGGGGAEKASSGSSAPAAGLVSPWAGTDLMVPSGWLLCDGRAVSRSGYPGLFAAIGTTYGAGDGSSTFSLPDYRGRTLVGRDPGQGEFDVLGESGGEKAVTLTEAQLAAHDHDFHGQTMIWGQGNISFSGNPQAAATPPGGNGLGTWQDLEGWAWTLDKGGNQPHNNLQPYAVANYIISTGAGSSTGVPAVLPVGLWQEFTLDLGGALNQPISGGAVVWNGPVSGNLGATLDGTKTTIQLPSAGTYRIVTHIGYYATQGVNVSGTIYLGGGALDRSNTYGVCTSANVFNGDVEITITVNGPATFTQGVSTASVYRWSWLRVEKIEPFYPKSSVLAVTQGSTALRDSVYGVPTSDAQRASLANRVISWFNTDKGWFETYYAVTGTAGLTARGLRSGNTPGWYPIGGAPVYISLQRNADMASSSAVIPIPFDALWASQNFPFTIGGTQIVVPFGGDYEVTASAVAAQSVGGNYINLSIRRNGAEQKSQSGAQFPHTNSYSRADIVPFILPMTTGQYVELHEQTSVAATISGGTALITVKYLGPPLA